MVEFESSPNRSRSGERCTATVVVPCFDEEHRLDADRFAAFGEAHPSVAFVFVDDGSRDGTREALRGLVGRLPRASVIDIRENVGKAEAVRRGVLEALRSPTSYVGYWDADLATPLEEIPRFIALLEEAPERSVVLGSRVKLMGRDIDRRILRHYVGRCFATAASMVLRMPVYDTQCGAKLLRVTEWLPGVFQEPFCVNWTFDVELLARLQRQLLRVGGRVEEAVYEAELQRWVDVRGSKIRAVDVLRVLPDLWRIRSRYPELRTPREAAPRARVSASSRSGQRRTSSERRR